MKTIADKLAEFEGAALHGGHLQEGEKLPPGPKLLFYTGALAMLSLVQDIGRMEEDEGVAALANLAQETKDGLEGLMREMPDLPTAL